MSARGFSHIREGSSPLNPPKRGFEVVWRGKTSFLFGQIMTWLFSPSGGETERTQSSTFTPHLSSKLSQTSFLIVFPPNKQRVWMKSRWSTLGGVLLLPDWCSVKLQQDSASLCISCWYCGGSCQPVQGQNRWKLWLALILNKRNPRLIDNYQIKSHNGELHSWNNKIIYI